jgi:hypothetical protein
VQCGVSVPGKGPCESYKGHHEGEHIGPGERCAHVSPGGIRCAARANHGHGEMSMHDVTGPRSYR